MNTELLEALSVLEKEKSISKDTILDAIEQSLLQACKNHFGKADNVTVTINRETGDFHVMAAKTVAEEVEDSVEQISLADAKMIDPSYEPGDIVNVEIQILWPYRHPECQKCDPAEDPRRRAKSTL